MATLSGSEVDWLPTWGADPSGRKLLHEGALYFAVLPEAAPRFRKLLDGGVFARLAEAGRIPPVEAAPFDLEGYPLVLRQEIVPFATYAFEWSPSMLQDAALAVLDLNRELLASGASTIDCHVFNVVFDGSRPRFVDLGSIVAHDPTRPWPPGPEFVEWYVRQLRLYRNRTLYRILRRLYTDSLGGLSAGEYHAMRGSILGRMNATIKIAGRVAALNEIPWLVRRRLFQRAAGGGRGAGFLRAFGHILPLADLAVPADRGVARLRRQVERIRFRYPHTSWGSYYREGQLDAIDWPADSRPDRIHRVLEELAPATVLDVGANEGFFSRMAAGLGARVAAVDDDVPAIDKLYRRIRGLPEGQRITPAVVNVVSPFPFGEAGFFAKRPAGERFRADLVLALAVTHHLTLAQGVPIDHAIGALSAYADRYLLVEFMPHGLGVERPRPDPLPAGYTLENFVASAGRIFGKVTTIETCREPSPRTLLVCER